MYLPLLHEGRCDKGKPVERRGRKATRLKVERPMPVELPNTIGGVTCLVYATTGVVLPQLSQ